MRRLSLCLITLILLSACGEREPDTTRGPVHEVRPGDTLAAIARDYQAEVIDIIRSNELTSISLRPGQRLIIPHGVAPSMDESPDSVDPFALPNWIHPRTAWTSKPVRVTGPDPAQPMIRPSNPRARRIHTITMHHTAEMPNVMHPDPLVVMQTIQDIHVGRKGWAAIGYHFIITRDGQIWEGRPLTFQGAHARGDNNIGNIGICLVGDFEHQRVHSNQQHSVYRLLDHLRNTYHIATQRIVGHDDMVHGQTLCPGRHLRHVMERYKRERQLTATNTKPH